MTKSEGLAQAQNVFTDWRMTRKTKKEPIPERLWGLAVSLLKTYPVSAVAKALRLNATTLRNKAKVCPITTKAVVGKNEALSKPTFLETRMTSRGVKTLAKEPCLIHIRREDGSQMKIHHPGLKWKDLSHLIRQFWGKG